MAWTDGITEVYSKVEELEEENRDLKAEIERLKEGIKFERERVNNIPNLLRQVKFQAIEEFWIKVRAYAVVMGCYHIVEYGDSVVKEMDSGK